MSDETTKTAREHMDRARDMLIKFDEFERAMNEETPVVLNVGMSWREEMRPITEDLARHFREWCAARKAEIEAEFAAWGIAKRDEDAAASEGR